MPKPETAIKVFHELSAAIGHINLDQPPVILISGEDPDLLDMALERVRHRLGRAGEQVELTSFSGEQGDDRKLVEQLYNMPLFSAYRLFLVRQAHEVLKPLVAAKRKGGHGALPARTLLLIDYRGRAPASLERLFGAECLHLAARDVYDNRMLETVIAAEKRCGLRLAEDARQLLIESVEKREGAVERAIMRLRDRIPQDRHQMIDAVQVRELLLPDVGFHVFELVDALFARDFAIVERELIRFNPATDSFFAVLKVMLGRTDELRRAIVGRYMGMNDTQVAELVGIKNRPPFIQKRILSRISQEAAAFGGRRLLQIYDLLVELQHDFRSRVPLHQQSLVFSERVGRLFLDDPEEERRALG